MKERRNANTLTSLAALGLLGVFAVCLLSAVLGGAGIYARLSRRDAEAIRRRTAVRCLSARVQSAGSAENVSVAAFGDGDALFITENAGGETYLTRLYCHDGWLMELYTARSGDFSPEDGEQLVQAESLKLRSEEGLLQMEVTSGGETAHLTLSLRQERRAAS